ncbi:MAG: quinolinate synthase [Crocinitomicaceae bacterium]|nr:quinolinate synthase [Crocinitomicaceae bacterium]|tara:strand:+ start:5395 stop:6402 length:1008 start_codon:yes stop_codon:yes gene_type:complete
MDKLLAEAKSKLEEVGYLDLPKPNIEDLTAALNALKKEKNAVILAHYYQAPEIQEIADYVGDSLGLSQQAASSTADIILFAGVHFMAETAKILSPHKKVILPDLKAGCSLAESCSAEELKQFKKSHPNHLVVMYVNTSAEVKALSDLVCTSSNAEKVINSIPKDKPILFGPDRNLGAYIKSKTDRDITLWDGACVVHEAFSLEKLIQLCKEYPKAQIVAHPESEHYILETAAFIGSTTQLINYVKSDPAETFIVATEAGVLHKMKKEVPEKTLIPAPAQEDNTCACSECAYMKLNTLEKLYWCLKHEAPEITLDEDLQRKALVPVKRMLELSSLN